MSFCTNSARVSRSQGRRSTTYSGGTASCNGRCVFEAVCIGGNCSAVGGDAVGLLLWRSSTAWNSKGSTSAVGSGWDWTEVPNRSFKSIDLPIERLPLSVAGLEDGALARWSVLGSLVKGGAVFCSEEAWPDASLSDGATCSDECGFCALGLR